MRCYSHLSDDEREQIGFGQSSRPFDRRDRASGRPSEIDDLARTLPQINCRADATRRFTPPEPINCAGGVKR